MKTLRTWAVLVSFLFLSIVTPMRAYAFTPPALGWLGAAPFAATESATLAPLVGNPLGAAVVALGAGYMLWQASQWNKCEGLVMHLSGFCTPQGWSRDAAGKPIPPAAASATGESYAVCTDPYDPALRRCYPSREAACNTVWGSNVHYLGTSGGGTIVECTNSRAAGMIMSGTNYTCPAGYTLSGTTCNLTDATKAKKPAGTPCQITINGGVFAYDTQNPACPATAPAPSTVNGIKIAVSPDGKTMTLSGPNGAIATVSLASPTIIIQQLTPMTDSAGSPITQVGTTTLDGSDTASPPKVQNQKVEYQNGQGQTPNASSTSPFQPNLSSSLDCSMISNCDWAKSSIQQQQLALQQQQLQAENTIKDKTTAIADAFTTTREAPPTSTDGDGANVTNRLSGMKQSDESYRGPLTGLLNKIGIPTSGGQCQLSRQITLFGHTFTLSFVQPGFCEMYQPIANWTMWSLIIVYAWNTLRRQHVHDS